MCERSSGECKMCNTTHAKGMTRVKFHERGGGVEKMMHNLSNVTQMKIKII